MCFVTEISLENLALDGSVWSAKTLHSALVGGGSTLSLRSVHRSLSDSWSSWLVSSAHLVTNREGQTLNRLIVEPLQNWSHSKRRPLEVLQIGELYGHPVIALSDGKGRVLWKAFDGLVEPRRTSAVQELLEARPGKYAVLPHGEASPLLESTSIPDRVDNLSSLLPPPTFEPSSPAPVARGTSSSYLDALENESIEIIREAYAAADKPGMLFSMGKDSMAMLTLAAKAFAPAPIPFPLVIIDTQWKFQDMYRFRAQLEAREDLSTIVYVNPEAIERDMNPFDFGSATHTDVTKTQALRKVLDEHKFDFVFGGARRDEEKSRAKERIFSPRSANHGWDPKSQRPELWNLYNTALSPGQSMRVFPISNWTEIDVWRYLERERVDLVPLYFSRLRPYVERNGALIMVDDERFPLEPGEKVHFDYIRFRTLGCYPLTGGVKSRAANVGEILTELEDSRVSERSSRVIDFDKGASMEQKKKDGYF